MRTKATVKNSVASLVYYAVTIIAGILLRKAIISFLGIEYQGIDGLFSNVITMLSIAELGIGTAIVSDLYKPLELNDAEQIKSLMALYRKCYRIIAFIVLGIGLVLIPVLPFLIKDYSLPYPLVTIYLWFLMDSVASYLLSYRRSILMADQKNYIVSYADATYMLLTKSIQAVIIWKTKNYYLLLSIGVIFRVVENAVIYRITSVKYPFLKEKKIQKLDSSLIEDIKRKVNGAVFHKVGSFVVTSSDSIIISSFLGLAVSGIYSNYFIIIRAIQNVCSKVIASATASIGHLLTENDYQKNKRVFNELQTINLFLTNCAVTGIYCCCTDVVGLLFGDQYTLDEFTVFFIALNLGFQCMREVYKSFKEAAGILYEDRFVPLFESAINIVTSIVLLKVFGLAGVFMGTIICELILYLYTYPILIFQKLLKTGYVEYIRDAVWQLGVILLSMVLGYCICDMITIKVLLVQLAAKALVSVIVSTVIFFFVYAVWRKEKESIYCRVFRLIRR